MAHLPLDYNGYPIQALRAVQGGGHTLAATSASQQAIGPFKNTSRIASVYAEQGCFFRFSTVDDHASGAAPDHYLPAGISYDFAIGGETDAEYPYLIVVQDSADGRLFVSEKE